MWSKWVRPAYDIFSWDHWFGQMDARPLGVFRILFVLVLLKDAIYHLFIGEMFYSDTGIAPRHLIFDLVRDVRWSLMDGLGADWQVTLFFLLWIAVLIGMLVGYQTKLMTILNWVIIVSVHERNILMLNGADTVMRVMSFWIIFLPVGRAYALDRLRKPTLPETAFAFPVRMIQLQFAFIYLSSFILKAHGQMWIDGSAVYHALQLRSFTHPIADWLLMIAPYGLFQMMTWFTFVSEGAFFLMVFLPFEQPALKLVGLVAMGSVHVGIGVLMAIPNFSMVMLAGYVLFFDGAWLVWLGKKLRPQHEFKNIPNLTPSSKLTVGQGMLVLITGSLLFNVYAYNLARMQPFDKPLGTPISALQLHTIQVLGIWQQWDMFAPNPFTQDGGLLVIGHLSDRQQIELRTGLNHDDDIPRFYFGIGTRWKKYDETLYYGWHPALIDAHAQYQCRKFNASEPEVRLEQVEMVYRSRQTRNPDMPDNLYSDQSILMIDCEK